MLFVLIILVCMILQTSICNIVNPHIILFENANLQGKSIELKGLSNWEEGIFGRYGVEFANYVCVKGLWLLYKDRLLRGTVEAGFSGNETFFCFEPNMTNITAIRSVPTLNKQRDTLYVYRRILVGSIFKGIGFITVDNMIFKDTNNFQTIMNIYPESLYYQRGYINSIADLSQLVVVGESSWTLYSNYNYTGLSICLNNKNTFHGIPNIVHSGCCFEFPIKSVRKGCHSENFTDFTQAVRMRNVSNGCSIESHPGNNISTGLKFKHVHEINSILTPNQNSSKDESIILGDSTLFQLKDYLDASLKVFYKICGEAVQEKYLEKVKVLFLYYVKEIRKEFSDQLDIQDQLWIGGVEILNECLNLVKPMNFVFNSRGNSHLRSAYAVNFEKPGTDGTNLTISSINSTKISPKIEKIEIIHQNLDPVIDTIWFAILGTFRACSSIENDHLKMLKVFNIFVNRLLKPMKNLWREPGSCSYDVMQNLFLSNSDKPIIMENIKVCSEAILLGIENITKTSGEVFRRIVRPIPYEHMDKEYENEEISLSND